MTEAIERFSASQELAVSTGKASLYSLLQDAWRRQRLPQELPSRLYDDLGIPPSLRPDFTQRGR